MPQEQGKDRMGHSSWSV